MKYKTIALALILQLIGMLIYCWLAIKYTPVILNSSFDFAILLVVILWIIITGYAITLFMRCYDFFVGTYDNQQHPDLTHSKYDPPINAKNQNHE